MLNSIRNIRLEFLKEGCKPPKYIILESFDEGMKFKSLISPYSTVVTPDGFNTFVEGPNNETYCQSFYEGIGILWPIK